MRCLVICFIFFFIILSSLIYEVAIIRSAFDTSPISPLHNSHDCRILFKQFHSWCMGSFYINHKRITGTNLLYFHILFTENNAYLAVTQPVSVI